MNKEKIQDIFKPESAMIVYSCKNEYYIETCDIDKDGKFGVMTPLSEAFLKKIVEEINDKEATSYEQGISILPENLLIYNNRPYKKVIGWKSEYKKSVTIKIGGRAYRFLPPPMIFVVINDTMYAYCYKIGKKGQYELYKAPYMNIYHDNKVCLGTVRIKKEFDSIEEELKWWEYIWWSSEFTGSLDDLRAKIKLTELWAIGDNRRYKFLEDYLVPMKTTLDKIIKTL